MKIKDTDRHIYELFTRPHVIFIYHAWWGCSLHHQTPIHYTHNTSTCDIWKLLVPNDGRLASQHKTKI